MKIISLPNDRFLPDQRKVFNPSIVEWRGSMLMYYRYERIGGDYNTDVAVVELDREWMPIPETNRALRLSRWSPRVTTIDDPRAFLWKDRIWMAYPQGCVIQTQTGWPWACSLALARFSQPHQHDGQWLPNYGRNINAASSTASIIATEKNWSPFIHQDRLFLVYTINPLVIVEFNPTLDQSNEVHRGPELGLSFWKHGFLGGGTPLLKRGDEYVGFFHSFTNDFPHQPHARTYHMGFYAISAREPFRLSRMSRIPLMTASHNNAEDLRDIRSTWRPNCIYPCGWLEKNDKVYISYGWQDCRCKIVEFSWDEIEENVIPVGEDGAPKPALPKKKPQGRLVWRCNGCEKFFEPESPAIATHKCP